MRAGDGLDSESNQVDGTQLHAEVGREDADATQQASDDGLTNFAENSQGVQYYVT